MTENLTRMDSLPATLDRLSRLESRLPVVSLYLDARPDSRGRDHYQPFVRKELAARQRTYKLRSPERESFDRDMEKIQAALDNDVDPSANGIAFFACSGDGDLFEFLQLERSFEENRLFVGGRPHVYLLARLIDENPRYAIVLADERSARIVVLARGSGLDEEEMKRPVPTRPHAGGVSQMRFQRHFEKLVQDHVKELVERLAHVVDEEPIEHIVLVGNEAIVPMIRAELPKRLAEKLVDSLHFDKSRPEAEIIEMATESLREVDAQSDADKVQKLLGEYRAGGLAALGPKDVRRALELGQADELLISAALNREDAAKEEVLGDLVALARRTDARISFIEDPELLASIDGVGALLRYRLPPLPEVGSAE